MKVAWSLMLFLGGLITLIYFGHIQFLPEVDLANVVAILASVAVVGLFIAVLLAVVFIAPGLALHELVQSGLLPSPRVESVGSGERIPLDVWVTVIVAALLLLFIIACFSSYYLLALSVAFVVTMVCIVFLVTNARTRSKFVNGDGFLARPAGLIERAIAALELSPKAVKVMLRPAQWIVLIGLWFIAGSVLLLPFVGAYSGQQDKYIFMTMGIWLVWAGFSNAIWGYSLRPPTIKVVSSFGAISLFVLLLVGSNPSFLSTLTFRQLGLGDIEPIQMSVTKHACSMIRAAVGENTACIKIADEDTYIVSKAKLLSRVGTQYLIEMPVRGEAGNVRAVIKKDDVLAWAFSGRAMKAGEPQPVDGDIKQPFPQPDKENSSTRDSGSANSLTAINLIIDEKWLDQVVAIKDNSVHFQFSETAKTDLTNLIRTTIDSKLTQNRTSTRKTKNISNTSNNTSTTINISGTKKTPTVVPGCGCECVTPSCIPVVQCNETDKENVNQHNEVDTGSR